jgi:hypothetical protein
MDRKIVLSSAAAVRKASSPQETSRRDCPRVDADTDWSQTAIDSAVAVHPACHHNFSTDPTSMLHDD